MSPSAILRAEPGFTFRPLTCVPLTELLSVTYVSPAASRRNEQCLPLTLPIGNRKSFGFSLPTVMVLPFFVGSLISVRSKDGGTRVPFGRWSVLPSPHGTSLRAWAVVRFFRDEMFFRRDIGGRLDRARARVGTENERTADISAISSPRTRRPLGGGCDLTRGRDANEW